MSIKEQKISLFIVAGVSEDFHFQTRTRKEISVSCLDLDSGIGD
jgi:mRNA-decapping enzyme subunit 2